MALVRSQSPARIVFSVRRRLFCMASSAALSEQQSSIEPTIDHVVISRRSLSTNGIRR